MDWSRFNVRTIWCAGPTDMVGIFMGYHGAGHILCDLWYSNGRLRLLLFNETGEIFYVFQYASRAIKAKEKNEPRTHQTFNWIKCFLISIYYYFTIESALHIPTCDTYPYSIPIFSLFYLYHYAQYSNSFFSLFRITYFFLDLDQMINCKPYKLIFFFFFLI